MSKIYIEDLTDYLLVGYDVSIYMNARTRRINYESRNLKRNSILSIYFETKQLKRRFVALYYYDSNRAFEFLLKKGRFLSVAI